MSAIGPSLPPHLAKRKRTPDDDTSMDTPPAKIRASEDERVKNNDEIDLESDSDDGYGPPAPKPAAKDPSIGPTAPPKSTVIRSSSPHQKKDANIGPSLPPPKDSDGAKRTMGPALPQQPTNTDEIPLDSEDDDEDVGPARQRQPAPVPPPTEPRRIHGPAPPPAPLSERPPGDPPNNASDSSDDDDDDDYGPALPTSSSHQQRQARAEARAAEEAANPQAPKRDDWMLAPPTSDGYRGAADPTKLKARRFNSGPRAGNSSGGGAGEISSIWTETPDEKRKRLENAVLGRSGGPGTDNHTSSATNSRTFSASATKTAADEAAIRSFTEATRGQSLYEQHQTARSNNSSSSNAPRTGGKKSWADEEDDDPFKRAFDKEKDMKLGGRIGASQRRELVNKAADFGGRFAKGKYL